MQTLRSTSTFRLCGISLLSGVEFGECIVPVPALLDHRPALHQQPREADPDRTDETFVFAVPGEELAGIGAPRHDLRLRPEGAADELDPVSVLVRPDVVRAEEGLLGAVEEVTGRVARLVGR